MTDILRGRTALITGASSGLGADFARELAGRGCNLILVARRMERLMALQTEIAAHHGISVECIPLDLQSASARQQLYDLLKSEGQVVDLLVNNAGLGLYGEFKDNPWESLQTLLDLDIVALTHLTRLFLPGMLERNFGYLLLIGSTGSFQPTPTYAVYSAAKSYVLSFGEALHYELRQSNVKCTVLCPGVTRTEFFEVSGQQMTAFQRQSMMESADVARIGIQALLKGRPSVVAGWLNAFLAWGTRFLPRQTLAATTARLMK